MRHVFRTATRKRRLRAWTLGRVPTIEPCGAKGLNQTASVVSAGLERRRLPQQRRRFLDLVGFAGFAVDLFADDRVGDLGEIGAQRRVELVELWP